VCARCVTGCAAKLLKPPNFFELIILDLMTAATPRIPLR
jgi:hypothetical protein